MAKIGQYKVIVGNKSHRKSLLEKALTIPQAAPSHLQRVILTKDLTKQQQVERRTRRTEKLNRVPTPDPPTPTNPPIPTDQSNPTAPTTDHSDQRSRALNINISPVIHQNMRQFLSALNSHTEEEDELQEIMMYSEETLLDHVTRSNIGDETLRTQHE